MKYESGRQAMADAPASGRFSPSGRVAATASTAGAAVRYTGRTRAPQVYLSILKSTLSRAQAYVLPIPLRLFPASPANPGTGSR